MTPEEKNARLKQALALEIGAGVSWDVATSAVAWAPPVYAGLNFLQGAGTNLLAQWWRGEENIAWGEVLASGGVGLVPGAAGSVSGAKAVARTAIKSAGAGVAHEGIRLGIDEQRLPTLQEAGTAATLGGVIGGGIATAAPTVSRTASNLKRDLITNIESNPYSKLRPFSNRLGLTETGTVGAKKTPRGEEFESSWDMRVRFARENALEGFYETTLDGKLNSKFNPYLSYNERKGIIDPPSPEEIIRRAKTGYNWEYLDEQAAKGAPPERPPNLPEINPNQRKIFSEGGIRDGYYDHYKYKGDGWMSGSGARKTLEAYRTPGRKYVPRYFEDERKRLLPDFLDEWGDYMINNGLATREQVASGIVGNNIELHHITPLKGGAQLYHKTHHGDEAWNVVTDVFYENDLFPGQGIPSPIPDAPGNNYLMALREPHNLLHNRFLYKILGRSGEKFFTPARMELIESGLEGRRMVAQEYVITIKKGQAVLNEAMRQMQAMFSKTGIPPEELAEMLSEAASDGTLKILDTDLLLTSVNKQLKAIVKDIGGWPEDFGTAFGDEVPEVIQEQITQAVNMMYTRVMKEYGLSGRFGYGRPPLDLDL